MTTRPVATLLRELRERKGQSLRSAADELGMAPSHLSRLERGERRPSDELATRFADYYGTTPDALAAATGRVPDDVVRMLLLHPEAITELRRKYGDSGSETR